MRRRLPVDTLISSPHEDAVSLVWRCHEALKGTRGVVMTLLFCFAERRDDVGWLSATSKR